MVCRHLSKDGTKLFFRGLRIWEAVVDELMGKGMDTAKQVFVDFIWFVQGLHKALTTQVLLQNCVQLYSPPFSRRCSQAVLLVL